jgi:ElaB/YqjD/DUF883 family membrane-anchored ribosome-binding protein
METDTSHPAAEGSPATGPTTDGSPAPTPAASGDGQQVQNQFRERFESLLPSIQKEWPEVARHTLEATRGSFDHVVEVISRQSGLTTAGVKQRLTDLIDVTGEQAGHVVDTLRPLEEQLEHLLDELNSTLRPRIEKPVRERPLMAIGIAAGVGLLIGLLLSSGRRSA